MLNQQILHAMYQDGFAKCEEKTINVEIRKDFKVNRQLLIIENTYKEKVQHNRPIA